MGELSRRRLLMGAGVATVAAGAVTVTRATSAAGVTGTEVDGVVYDEGGQVFNIRHPAYDAKGDTVMTTGGSISATSTAFTTNQATFAAGDVGKVVTVQGAGNAGAVLSTTIAAVVDASHVTLASTAGTSVVGADFAFGTDDTAAIVAAITAAGASGTVLAPSGIYLIRGASNNNTLITLGGTGGMVGAGGRHSADAPAATVFLSADATAGINPNGWAIYRGFLCHGNNIAATPLQNGKVVAGAAQGSGSYGTFLDVWTTASTGNGWSIYGCQNNTYYACGSTDNALDGLYIDGGAGGLDFWHWTESGSGRYGVHGDHLILGVGGYSDRTKNNHFLGGRIASTAATRTGTSKVYLRWAEDWKFLDMTIRGDNLTGPTIDLSQAGLSYGIDLSGSTISSPQTGNAPGLACIQVTDTPMYNKAYTFIKTDRMRFLAGDTSVYITTTGKYLYWAIDWILDATTNGPMAATGLSAIDTLLSGRTGPWHTPTLNSPWSGNVAYRLRADGLVEFKGSVTCSDGTGGPLFTLPTGFGPTGDDVLLPVSRSDGVNVLVIAAAGTVSSSSSATGTIVYLDGIRFPTN